ncbi:MAG: glycosyltransferase family 4 protein [Candidatus Rokuibacteriota bacterium]
MRIAQVAPLYEPVPPALYGGTERIVSFLTEELVRRGHDVTLFATGDSTTAARLVSALPKAIRLEASNREALLAAHVRQLGMVFHRAREFDVIHCHVDYPAFPLTPLVATPTVHSVHGRLDLPYLEPVYRQFRGVPVVSISDAQRAPLASVGVNWVATVPHGVPLGRYPFVETPDGYLAFLGRISPEKRPHVAIDVARRVGIPLKMAAKVDPADRDYFERMVRPLLDDPLIEFVGEIGDRDKPRFLGGALALLFPIDWPEPFGLVMIEAMACGTPVIACPAGSVAEVVVPGRTGFIGETEEELASAVKRIDTIDRAECRRHVEHHFTAERMADGYEEVYARLSSLARAA